MDKFKALITSLEEIRSVVMTRGTEQVLKDRMVTNEVDIVLAYVNSPNADTGVDVIAKERWEQTDKHQFTIEGDVEHNTNEQLAQAAVFVLTENPEDYPDGWEPWLMENIRRKGDDVDGTIEKLGIAGALIAAEIDRLVALKAKKNGKG